MQLVPGISSISNLLKSKFFSPLYVVVFPMNVYPLIIGFIPTEMQTL